MNEWQMGSSSHTLTIPVPYVMRMLCPALSHSLTHSLNDLLCLALPCLSVRKKERKKIPSLPRIFEC